MTTTTGADPLRHETVPALADTFAMHRMDVERYLRRRTGSTQIAEDLVSMVFEAASIRYRRGQGYQVTRAWLFAVARNKAIDHWRQIERQRRLRERLQCERLDEGCDEGNWPVILADLSPKHRAILIQRYVVGDSVSAIAETHGVSYRAAESLLSRARVACRRRQ